MSLRVRLAGSICLLILLVLVDATLTMLLLHHGVAWEANPIVGNLEDGRFLFKILWPFLLFIGLIRPKEWFVTAIILAANVFAILIVYECIGAWLVMR